MLSENFLWGGAVAAHQLEGGWDADGRGPSVSDVMTAGALGVPRRITDGIVPGERYPNHDGINFYRTYKEDIKLFAELGVQVLPHLHFLEPHLSPGATSSSPTRPVCSSTTTCLTSC